MFLYAWGVKKNRKNIYFHVTLAAILFLLFPLREAFEWVGQRLLTFSDRASLGTASVSTGLSSLAKDVSVAKIPALLPQVPTSAGGVESALLPGPMTDIVKTAAIPTKDFDAGPLSGASFPAISAGFGGGLVGLVSGGGASSLGGVGSSDTETNSVAVGSGGGSGSSNSSGSALDEITCPVIQ